jgi:hypothetical protein
MDALIGSPVCFSSAAILAAVRAGLVFVLYSAEAGQVRGGCLLSDHPSQ